jgi:hypothetical protein
VLSLVYKFTCGVSEKPCTEKYTDINILDETEIAGSAILFIIECILSP